MAWDRMSWAGPRRLWRLLVLAVALTSWAAPSEAAIVGAIAKAIAKAGKAAKGAKGAAAAGKAAKGGTLIAGGAALAAERSGVLFKLIPDDAGRAVAYLAHEPDGAFRTVLRSGEQATHAPGELGPALGKLATPETPKVDIYLDLSAATQPQKLATPTANQRLFVLDKHAQPLPVRVERKADGTLDFVDAADGAIGLDGISTELSHSFGHTTHDVTSTCRRRTSCQPCTCISSHPSYRRCLQPVLETCSSRSPSRCRTRATGSSRYPRHTSRT